MGHDMTPASPPNSSGLVASSGENPLASPWSARARAFAKSFHDGKPIAGNPGLNTSRNNASIRISPPVTVGRQWPSAQSGVQSFKWAVPRPTALDPFQLCQWIELT